MDKGVLLYCFDTKDTRYSDVAKKCISLVARNLKLPVTVVCNTEAKQNLLGVKGIDIVTCVPKQGNKRNYKGEQIDWFNQERFRAYEHSPYEQTLLMDCDFFCFSNELLKYFDSTYDFLCHDKVHDATGSNRILGKNECLLPIVWATVIYFRKTTKVKMIFEMVNYVKNNYKHFSNLYRIKFRNFRNDYAFAIALHQLNGMMPHKEFFAEKMFMIDQNTKVVKFLDNGIVFARDGKINSIEHIDIHVLDKECCYV